MPETHLEATRGPLTQKVGNHTASINAALIRLAFAIYGHVDKHKETARGLRPLTVNDEPSNNDETRRECITTPDHRSQYSTAFRRLQAVFLLEVMRHGKVEIL